MRPARSSDALRIEPMALSDLPCVIAVAARSFQENPSRESSQSPGVMSGAQIREELTRPWARMWVAREQRDAIAFAIAWHVVDELHVLNIATHPDFRRRGIARALMNEIIVFARAHDVRHILLEVRRTNIAAIRLYRTLEFFAMGIRKHYYPDDEDAIEMGLLFDPTTKEIVKKTDDINLDCEGT